MSPNNQHRTSLLFRICGGAVLPEVLSYANMSTPSSLDSLKPGLNEPRIFGLDFLILERFITSETVRDGGPTEALLNLVTTPPKVDSVAVREISSAASTCALSPSAP